jgi:hypothetical protein
MGRTFIRQDAQIASTLTTLAGFLDNIPPTQAAYETNASDLANDLNNVRSQLQNFLNRNGASFPTGSWWDDLVQPTSLENGTVRGINATNSALHLIEKKRVMRGVSSLVDITVTAAQNWEVLATGELPSNTKAAVGAVTTVGTIVAAHGGTFDTHSLTEVTGATALSPKNLVEIVDGATRDPILDSNGRRIWALLQTETATDGHIITDTTPTRAQLSFVTINATGDDLIACPVADIAGKTVNVVWPERIQLESLTEQDFLRGAIADVPSGATVTRQVAYDNQGATPVELANNALLDIGTGLYWGIRDVLNADLLKITEGSTGGTTKVELAAAVDLFDSNAIVNDFNAGIQVRTGGTRPINIGVNDGLVETSAGALEVKAATVLSFDDSYSPAGWSLTEGIHLSDSAQEWTDFESYFGEASLLSGINQAFKKQKRTKVQAVLTANVTAGLDVNGPSYANNTDVNLLPYNLVPTSFVQDVEVYLNGELLRNNATSGANDVYPGTTPSQGDLMFTFNLLGTGAKPDQLTVIVNGQ